MTKQKSPDDCQGFDLGKYLLQQQQLLRINKIASLNAIKIQSARKSCCVELHLIGSCFFSLIGQRCDFLGEHEWSWKLYCQPIALYCDATGALQNKKPLWFAQKLLISSLG